MKQLISILFFSLLFSCSPNQQQSNSPKYLNQVVVFGEYHGTKEIPEFFFKEILKEYQHSKNLTIGLELPDKFSDTINYLNNLETSISKKKIREKFSEDDFWCNFGDGRHSKAMLSLLVDVTSLKLKNSASNISIVFLNTGNGVDKDGAIAFSNAFNKNKDSSGFVLTGNYHARLTKMLSYLQGPLPLSGHLRTLGSNVIALNISTKKGNAWMCMATNMCEAKPVMPTNKYVDEGVYLDDKQNQLTAYSGEFFIEELSVDTVPINITANCADSKFKFTL